MIRQRTTALRLAVAAAIAVVLVTAWVLIREWMELPGVPADVVKSAASGHVRIVAEGHASSPGNDWEDSYALLSVSSDGDPVEDIEGALRSAGWSTRAGGVGPLVLSGDTPADRPKYGVTVQTYEDFDCLDRSEVCEEFEKAAQGRDEDLFVATFMPYV
ncbi:hypothetical protein ACQEV2_39955 [Streptomyces sp. CA-251387]|uniref:hypothetical protein n=1 Tax=Streptomyces sp. CA-251387 TaxID=3240064 RepID=UPI003D91683D